MPVVVLLLIFAIQNIAVVCKIVTSNEIYHFVTVTLKSNLLRYFVTFFYCNLLQLQVTEKSNLLTLTSLLVTSYYPTLVMTADTRGIVDPNQLVFTFGDSYFCANFGKNR